MAQYPSGKGEVCKTFMSRSDSDLRLKKKPAFGLAFLLSADVNKFPLGTRREAPYSDLRLKKKPAFGLAFLLSADVNKFPHPGG